MGQAQASTSRSAQSPLSFHKRLRRAFYKAACVSQKATLSDGEATYAPTQASGKVTHNLNSSSMIEIAASSRIVEGTSDSRFSNFLSRYPEYALTHRLDDLRQSDFVRLDSAGAIYVDYMGGCLYPERLISSHSLFLGENILGNTHSASSSSAMSSRLADEARAAVLAFFKAPPGYTVIFTTNASAALKLVGESYTFTRDGSLVLSEDSHNSVHGLRVFATRAGAAVHYVPATPQDSVDDRAEKNCLSEARSTAGAAPCLFALTGQSNISNSKCSLDLITYASSLGYDTVMDAAALAPTSLISLEDLPLDAMAVSFYKMFGYPTGVGALIAKDSFLKRLQRPWFAGGTVDVVQVPGKVVTMVATLHEQFEDGTINYLALPAITNGLRCLSDYIPLLPLRLSTLLDYLATELSALEHTSTGSPVVRILSRLATQRPQAVGEQSDTGFLLSLLFYDPNEVPIPLSLVEEAATMHRISLRTGCMCNPGGTAVMLGLRDVMAGPVAAPGITTRMLEQELGMELGVARISLGLASNFADVCSVIEFARRFDDWRGMDAYLACMRSGR